jgi:hypothetical protein
MTLTKKKKEELKIKKQNKIGKKCEDCGSEFEITELHKRTIILFIRKNPNKPKHIIYLCATCHELRDFDKSIACYTKAKLKKYDKQMTELEKYYEKKDKKVK